MKVLYISKKYLELQIVVGDMAMEPPAIGSISNIYNGQRVFGHLKPQFYI